jgi:hypothetical protein
VPSRPDISPPGLTFIVSTVASKNKVSRTKAVQAIAWSGLTKPSASKASRQRQDLGPVLFYSRHSLGMHIAMPSVSSIKARPFTNNAW